MGLKSTMKKNQENEKQESNSKEQEMLVEEQAQEIQTLLSMLSINQSKVQEMQLALTNANAEIELLKKRASSVNKTELENKRLLSVTQKALEESDSAKRKTEQALRQAYAETERAMKAREQAKQDSKERYEAQQEVRHIERTTERSKLTYKTLFIGNSIFTLVLAFFVALSKREVLMDMLKWFPLRFNNLKSLLSWIATKYMAAIRFIQTKWELNNIWNYVIVTLLFIGLGVGLFFIIKYLIKTIKRLVKNIHEEYTDKLFKRIISGNIAIAILFICLFFAEQIQSILSFNILSIWLILSLIGIALWHAPEIKRVVK